MTRKIEGVQRSFTARIRGLASFNYRERLSALRLYSLQRRRERYLVIYAWKILNGHVPNIVGADALETYETPRSEKKCRIPPLLSNNVPRCVQTIRENSFFILAPHLFNCLPARLRDFEGAAEDFKGKLDDFLKVIPDKPSHPHYYQSAAGNSIIDQLR